jgi:hypothetical protein
MDDIMWAVINACIWSLMQRGSLCLAHLYPSDASRYKPGRLRAAVTAWPMLAHIKSVPRGALGAQLVAWQDPRPGSILLSSQTTRITEWHVAQSQ